MKRNFQFFLFLALSIGVIVLGKTEPGRKTQILLAKTLSPLQKYPSFLSSLLSIRKENKMLKKELANLYLDYSKLLEYKYENEHLRELLEFKEKAPYQLVVCEVIARSFETEVSRVLINKGSDESIQPNMPCITLNGIYGKVIKTEPHTAFVQTIFDFGFRASAQDARSNAQGIVKWKRGVGCILDNVPIGADVKVGDRIITSGVGGIFPKGLNIGEVTHVEIGKRRLFYSIKLNPYTENYPSDILVIIKETTQKGAKGISSVSRSSRIHSKSTQKSPKKTLNPKIPRPKIRFESEE